MVQIMKFGPVLPQHNPADFDIVAESLYQFIDAVTLPEPCKVLLNANIDMTDLWMIEVSNKFIASNFKTIKARKLYKDTDPQFQWGNCMMFNFGENVQLSGLKVVGCQGEILDQNYVVGQMGFAKVGENLAPATNFQMRNCIITKTDSWGVLLNNANGALIEHCTFSNIRRNGAGYASWQRSPSGQENHICIVRYNRFINFRHCIDGAGQLNWYEFSDNLTYGSSLGSPVARHANDTFQGGAGDVIKNNWFCDRSRPFSLQEVITV
jgi:hypothetical protein